jgi:tRNA 5-methylaminomethyl-2-thiouridine biosynthesis bifunctional protein
MIQISSQAGYLLDHAAIDWHDDASPWSEAFEDIYWHREGGLAEKQYVFIEANHLRARWSDLQQPQFTILETGFGFGLNFLLAARLWQELAPPGKLLHYQAIEYAPVTPADLEKLHASLCPPTNTEPDAGALHDLAQRLVRRYPLPTHGLHPIWITDTICLTLIYMDVGAAMPLITEPVDAFFLDGFSPSQNAAMWDPKLFSQCARLSHQQTTLSTYSVAGTVKRGLKDAGFEIKKIPGFAGKAEMLTARTTTAAPQPRHQQTSRVVIVGGGLAGLNCAAALLRRGIKVEIIEAQEQALMGASSIPQLAVYPQLAAVPDNRACFSLAAFQYLAQQAHYHACGFHLTPDTAVLKERLRRINDFFPDSFAHLTPSVLDPTVDSLFFPTAGWLSAIEAFSDTLTRITLRSSTHVAGLQRINNTWHMVDAAGQVITTADTVIIATGANTLPQTQPLNLNSNRGQALQVQRNTGRSIETVISGPVSIFPADAEGRQTVSGTHQRNSSSSATTSADTAELLARLQRFLPGEVASTSAHAGVRAASRDRLPVVGPIPDWSALENWCRQRARAQPAFTAYQPGLYLCTAMGSHGATHAPLCGEHLARIINHEPAALNPEWRDFLGVERFMIRDLVS